MAVTYFVFALAGIGYAAPWPAVKFPSWTSEDHPNHPGWTESQYVNARILQ